MKNENDAVENIINFAKVKGKYVKKISDEEINALFLGLIKIVKKSALDDVSRELKEDCECANANFRECLIELNSTQIELKKLKEENEMLCMKLEIEQEHICRLLRKISKKKNAK